MKRSILLVLLVLECFSAYSQSVNPNTTVKHKKKPPLVVSASSKSTSGRKKKGDLILNNDLYNPFHKGASCGSFHYRIPPLKYCHNKDHYDSSGKHMHQFEYYDRFGNIYCNEYFKYLKKSARNINQVGRAVTTNHFTAIISNNVPAAYDAVIQRVLSDLDTFLIFNNGCADANAHARIFIRYESLTNQLAAASSFYRTSFADLSHDSPIINSVFWGAVNGRNTIGTAAQLPAGQIKINSNIDFYLGLDATDTNNDGFIDDPAAIGRYELYGVLLHEILHTMGFASILNTSGIGQGEFMSTGGQGVHGITRFDTLLELNGTSVVSESLPPVQWNLAVPNFMNDCDGIINNGSPATALHYYNHTGTNEPERLSHIATCANNVPNKPYLMEGTLLPRQLKRLSQEEFQILERLGYRLNSSSPFGTFTPTFTTSLYAMNDPCSHLDPNNQNNSDSGYIHLPCGTTHFSFDDNFLMANDIIDSSAPVVVDGLSFFNVINDDVASLEVVSTGHYNLTWTPAAQTVKLVYWLRNTVTNEVSNSAFVNFYIDTCSDYYPDFGSSAIEDGGCDLIPNSTFIGNDTIFVNNFGIDYPIYFGFNNAIFSSGPYFEVSNQALPGWYPRNSLSRIYSATANVSPPLIPDGSGHHIKTRLNSSVITTLSSPIVPNKKYILSLFGGKESYQNNIHVAAKLVALGNSLPPINSYFGGVTNDPHFDIFNNNYSVNNSNNWSQFIQSFTYTGTNANLNFLEIGIGNSANYDNVELLEDKMTNEYINTNVAAACGQATIGTPLCKINGMNFSWFDITGGANIQLTDNTTDLDPSDNVTIPSNGNGSEINLTGITTYKRYKLKRTFLPSVPNSNGDLIQIESNNADQEIIIGVIPGGNAPASHFQPLDFGENNHGKIKTSVATDSQGNIFIVGSVSDLSQDLTSLINDAAIIDQISANILTSGGCREGFLMKLCASGSFLKAIPYNNLHAVNLKIDSNDNLYLLGNTNLRKYDNNLNLINSVNVSLNQIDYFYKNMVLLEGNNSTSICVEDRINVTTSSLQFYDENLSIQTQNTIDLSSVFLITQIVSDSNFLYILADKSTIGHPSYLYKINLSTHQIQEYNLDDYINAAWKFLEIDKVNGILYVGSSDEIISVSSASLSPTGYHYTASGISSYIVDEINYKIIMCFNINMNSTSNVALVKSISIDSGGNFGINNWTISDVNTANTKMSSNILLQDKTDSDMFYLVGEYDGGGAFGLPQSVSSFPKVDSFLMRIKNQAVGRYATSSVEEFPNVIYPNPFDNTLSILKDKNKKILAVKLANSMGTDMPVKLIDNSSNYSIDTSRLGKGIYFLKILFENGKSTTMKVFKN